MNVPETRSTDAASFDESRRTCQILILNEDFASYNRAVEVCRQVMDRFGNHVDFDVRCWSAIELADSTCARHAARTAGVADLILLSVRTAELPGTLDQWLDFSLASRSRADGVLALVVNALDAPAVALEGLSRRLEQVAIRLGMGFLVVLPGDAAEFINLPAAAALGPILPEPVRPPGELRKSAS